MLSQTATDNRDWQGGTFCDTLAHAYIIHVTIYKSNNLLAGLFW